MNKYKKKGAPWDCSKNLDKSNGKPGNLVLHKEFQAYSAGRLLLVSFVFVPQEKILTVKLARLLGVGFSLFLQVKVKDLL